MHSVAKVGQWNYNLHVLCLIKAGDVKINQQINVQYNSNNKNKKCGYSISAFEGWYLMFVDRSRFNNSKSKHSHAIKLQLNDTLFLFDWKSL